MKLRLAKKICRSGGKKYRQADVYKAIRVVARHLGRAVNRVGVVGCPSIKE